MSESKKKELNSCELLNSSCANLVHNKTLLDNSTTSAPKCQCIENELDEKWNPKKKLSERLVLSYLRLDYPDKADKVSGCGTFLEFAKYADDTYKLHRANFCRDRLCPLCSWRRSYKIFGQVSQIMNVICNDYEFIFLTLTVPNCEGEDLSKTIDRMNEAWKKFVRYARISKVCKGYFKALEVTYNKTFDTYHPHFHVVIAVPLSYYKRSDYIQRSEWLELWQRAMKDPSITQVDVRKARSKESNTKGKKASELLSSAIAEIAKYSVKPSDYLFIDERQTDACVYTFMVSLENRRLCAFGGVFREAFDKLGLDDSENGDLIHLDNELRSDVALQIYRYGWSCGAYKLNEIIDKSNILAECDE